VFKLIHVRPSFHAKWLHFSLKLETQMPSQFFFKNREWNSSHKIVLANLTKLFSFGALTDVACSVHRFVSLVNCLHHNNFMLNCTSKMLFKILAHFSCGIEENITLLALYSDFTFSISYLSQRDVHLTILELNYIIQGFLRCFRDPIRVPRIENRVTRIRENYHRVPRIRQNRVPRIREIGTLQVHTGYLTYSLKKKPWLYICLFKSTYTSKWEPHIRPAFLGADYATARTAALY